MNGTVLTTIAITGFGIAFFHAAIPTHWLPFVLTARAQHWNHGRALAVTALAGAGHVLFTALLGFLIAWFGIVLNQKIGAWFPRIAGTLLIGLGLFYLTRQFFARGHEHNHFIGGHAHAHETDHQHSPKSDRLAITGLLAMLTFSPCEAFLPIYASGIRFGWGGFVLLTMILSVGTVAGMVLFTGLTLAGVKKIRLRALENYEGALVGVLLCVVGTLVLLFEK